MTLDELDALETALARVKRPWLSLPGDPSYLMECEKRASLDLARDEALRNAASSLIATARRVQELEAALAPFASALRGNYSHQRDSFPLVCGNSQYDLRFRFTVGDFRRAGAALEPKP